MTNKPTPAIKAGCMSPDVRIDDGAEQGRARAQEGSTHPMRLRSASRPPASAPTIQVSDSIESTEPNDLFSSGQNFIGADGNEAPASHLNNAEEERFITADRDEDEFEGHSPSSTSPTNNELSVGPEKSSQHDLVDRESPERDSVERPRGQDEDREECGTQGRRPQPQQAQGPKIVFNQLTRSNKGENQLQPHRLQREEFRPEQREEFRPEVLRHGAHPTLQGPRRDLLPELGDLQLDQRRTANQHQRYRMDPVTEYRNYPLRRDVRDERHPTDFQRYRAGGDATAAAREVHCDDQRLRAGQRYDDDDDVDESMSQALRDFLLGRENGPDRRAHVSATTGRPERAGLRSTSIDESNTIEDIEAYMHDMVDAAQEDDRRSCTSSATDARLGEAEQRVARFRHRHPEVFKRLTDQLPKGGLLLAAQAIKTHSFKADSTLAPLVTAGDPSEIDKVMVSIKELQFKDPSMAEFQMVDGIFTFDMWTSFNKLFQEQTKFHLADLISQTPLGFLSSQGAPIGFSLDPSQQKKTTVRFGFNISVAPGAQNGKARVVSQNEHAPAFLYTTSLVDPGDLNMLLEEFGYESQLSIIREGGRFIDAAVLKNLRLLHVLNYRFLEGLRKIFRGQKKRTAHIECVLDLMENRLQPGQADPIMSGFMSPDLLTYVGVNLGLRLSDAQMFYAILKDPAQFPQEECLEGRLISLVYSALPSYDEGLETFASRFLQLTLDVQMECKHPAVNDNSMAQQMLNALSKSIYSSTAEDSERFRFIEQLKSEFSQGHLKSPKEMHKRIRGEVLTTRRYLNGAKFSAANKQSIPASAHAFAAQGASGGGKAKQQQRGSTGHSSKGGQRSNEDGKGAAARASDSQKATDAVTAYRQQALILVRLLAKLRKRGVQVPAILKKMQFIVDDLKPAGPKDTKGVPYPLLRVELDPATKKPKTAHNEDVSAAKAFLKEHGKDEAANAYLHMFRTAASDTELGQRLRSAPLAGTSAGSQPSARTATSAQVSGETRVYNVTLSPSQLNFLHSQGINVSESGQGNWGWGSGEDTGGWDEMSGPHHSAAAQSDARMGGEMAPSSSM